MLMKVQIVGIASFHRDITKYLCKEQKLVFSISHLFLKTSILQILTHEHLLHNSSNGISPLRVFISFQVCNSLFSTVTVTLPQSHTTHSCVRQRREEHTHETAHLFRTRNWGENSGSHKAASLLHVFFCPSHARSRPALRLLRTEQRQRRCRCPRRRWRRRPSVVLAVSGGGVAGRCAAAVAFVCVCECMEKNVRGRQKTDRRVVAPDEVSESEKK